MHYVQTHADVPQNIREENIYLFNISQQTSLNKCAHHIMKSMAKKDLYVDVYFTRSNIEKNKYRCEHKLFFKGYDIGHIKHMGPLVNTSLSAYFSHALDFFLDCFLKWLFV